jgi:SAM-dependent methyltransferase
VSVDPNAVASWAQDAAGYERARPGWPPAALDWLGARLPLDGTVLDLAAGTGKLTRLLLARAARVIAVEPLAGMRAQLARTAPAAEILDGHAAGIPLADASVDAVLVAEAFHWFATPQTLAEVRRVLRPGGGLGLMWNLEQFDPDEPWVRRLVEVLPDRVNLHPTPRATWDVLTEDAGFGAAQSTRVGHAHALDATGLADLVGSWSRVATRPAEERAALHERLLTVAPAGVRLHYETLVVAAPVATV